MALLDQSPWEVEQQRKRREAKAEAEARRKEEFIQKWISVSSALPEEQARKQAEILWKIFLLASAPSPIPLELMRF